MHKAPSVTQTEVPLLHAAHQKHFPSTRRPHPRCVCSRGRWWRCTATGMSPVQCSTHCPGVSPRCQVHRPSCWTQIRWCTPVGHKQQLRQHHQSCRHTPEQQGSESAEKMLVHVTIEPAVTSEVTSGGQSMSKQCLLMLPGRPVTAWAVQTVHASSTPASLGFTNHSPLPHRQRTPHPASHAPCPTFHRSAPPAGPL